MANPIKYSDLVIPDGAIIDLIAQLKQLDEQYGQSLSNIRKEAEALAEVLKKTSGATEEGRKATKAAATDADRLAKAQDKLTQAQSENAAKIEEINQATREALQMTRLQTKLNNAAEGSYNKLSAQYSLNKMRLNAMSKAEREATKEGRELEAQTKDLYEEMKRLQEATGKHQLNVGNYPEMTSAVAAYGDKLVEAVGLNNDLGRSLLNLAQNGGSTVSVFKGMRSAVYALGKTLAGLLANPVFLAVAGVAGAGVAFKWWYDYNAGIMEATRLTQNFTNKQGDDLKNYRSEVQALADTFNKDFKEVLIATNAVAKQFGISQDEALKLVRDGFVAGADANGEYLDTLREYPAYFREAGLSAEAFIALVTQTSTAGIFSDKGVDAIKEANIRLREMTTSTATALNNIGISSEAVQKALQDGSKTTFDIMQEVSAKLAQLPESSAAVGTAIADIFGGPGEDAGYRYLATLKDINTEMDVIKARAGEVADIQERQLESQVELQNAVNALFDRTGGVFERLIGNAKVFINQSLTGIIIGVINVVNYFIEWYNNILLLRIVWSTVVSAFQVAFRVLGAGFGVIGDLVAGLGKAIQGIWKGIIGQGWEEFQQGINQVALAVPRAMKKITDAVAEEVVDVVENSQKRIKPLTIPVRVEGDSGTIATTASTTAEKVVANATSTSGTTTSENKGKTPEEVAQEYRDIAEQWINEQYELSMSEIDIMQASEHRKTELRLKAEKERIEKILKLGQYGSEEERKIMENTIKLIQGEIDKLAPEDIYDALGFNFTDEQKNAIDTSIGYATEALNTYLTAQTNAANKAVSNADTEVEAAQRALEAEIEARNNGYAHNVEQAQKDLALAKKTQAKALEEQKRAQRAQEVINSLQQVSDLVTASAKIWAQLGFPGAIPALATMWGSFAYSKVKAVQMSSEQYGDGTVELLEGGSHASGHDIDLGVKADGTRRRAEGGEFFAVINKRNSRRYRSIIPNLINSLNDGTFERYMSAFNGSALNVNINSRDKELAGLGRDVRAIRTQGERREISDGRGRIVYYKNLKRRVV